MWSSLLARILTPRSTSPSCSEGEQLRAEWDEARQPYAETALERLDLYEERKFLARAALVAHRQFCSQCLGSNATTSPGQGSMNDQPNHFGDSINPDSRKAA